MLHTKAIAKTSRRCFITSVANGAGKTVKLTAEDRTARMAKFQSHLKARPVVVPKGPLPLRQVSLKTKAAPEAAAKAKTSAKATAKA